MSLEASLERIATALETIAGKPPGKASAKSGKSPQAAASKGSQKEPDKSSEPAGDAPDLATVRKALTALQKRETPAAAKKVLKEVGGATTLTKLPEDKYQAVIDAAGE